MHLIFLTISFVHLNFNFTRFDDKLAELAAFKSRGGFGRGKVPYPQLGTGFI